MGVHLKSDARHDEDDGELKQALEATESGVLHAQSRDLVRIGLVRQQLLEYSNLIWNEKSERGAMKRRPIYEHRLFIPISHHPVTSPF